ncbi:Protein of unknown function (DUF4005) [Dionaea muscipula]
MGRASRWLSKLLRRKKPSSTGGGSLHADADGGNKGGSLGAGEDGDGIDIVDPSKHAIAVAAATAAVAEAAIAAARAAAEVVRLTSGGAARGRLTEAAAVVEAAASGGGGRGRVSSSGRRLLFEEFAAVKLQAAFRGYLARRALKALKGLVKLQALVRGYLVRQQSADMLRRMQAMGLKYQLHQRDAKIDDSSSILKRSIAASKMREARMREQALSGANWLDNFMEESSRSINQGYSMRTELLDLDDIENTDKILQVDSWKPQPQPQPHLKKSHGGRSRSGGTTNSSSIDYYHDHSFSAASDTIIANYSTSKLEKPTASPFSDLEVSSMRSLSFQLEGIGIGCTAETSSSPQTLYSVVSSSSRPGSSSRGGTRRRRTNESSSTSFLNNNNNDSYMMMEEGHPNYMANTESYQAKVRCQSAPRQRLEESSEKKPPHTHSVKRSNFTSFQDNASLSYLRRRSSDQDDDSNSMRKFYSGPRQVK